MSNVTFPPTLPVRFSRFVEVEIIDSDTIKLKNKKTGEEIGTITRTQLQQAVDAVTPPASKE